jgi:hypothetical protein
MAGRIAARYGEPVARRRNIADGEVARCYQRRDEHEESPAEEAKFD